MSHIWKHEDDYFRLMDEIKRAKENNNSVLYEQLQSRIKVLDNIIWNDMTVHFTELSQYQTLVEALEQTALRIGVPFPTLKDERNHTGDGQFIFGVSDGIRTVQIWPLEDFGYYRIEIFEYGKGYEQGRCYQGQTTSLEEATILLSQWYVERCSIEELHALLPWMSREPFKLKGSRITLE